MKTFYVVLASRGGEDVIETIRTDKRAAEQDVSLFKEVVRRHAWIQEVEK